MTEKLYDVEADWIMFSGCNYRCDYCFWPDEVLRLRPSPPAEMEHMADFFDRTGLRWLIHLTGGEPFLYPRFVELVTRLTAKHLVSVNSNLSTDRVLRFVEEVNPDRVSFMNCALHVSQREMRGRVEDFVRKMKLLRAAGFKAFATYVFFPPLMDRVAADFATYAAEGVTLFPKAFRGTWQGERYPAAYTQEERDLFMKLSSEAEMAYADMWAERRTPPTIDPLIDRDLVLHGVQDYRGRMCDAGRHFFRIRENGDIQRCGPSELLGSIVTGTLQRKAEPAPCQDLECPYFCYKYLVPAGEAATETVPTPALSDGPAAGGDSALPGADRPESGQLLARVRSLAGGIAGRWPLSR